MKQPTWLLAHTLTKKEAALVQQLRKVDPAMRDDFERMLVSFLDEQERIMEFCAYHESLLEGQSYMESCAYDRDIAHDLALQGVA